MMLCRAAMLTKASTSMTEVTHLEIINPEEHTNYTHVSRCVTQAEQFGTYCMYVPHIPHQVPPGALITKAVRVHLCTSSRP